MDEVKEQQQIAEEISNAISHPIGFGHDVDEDELLKVTCNIEMLNRTNEFLYSFQELEELEQEELDKQLLETEEPGKLPEVPVEVPVPAARKLNSQFIH